MRKLSKTISLEDFKSRMPSIVPAYDSNGKQHNFSHFIDFSKDPLINYGMIPFDVQIDENDNFGEYSGKLFTFKELTNIFHKLDEKYNNIMFETCVEKEELLDFEKEFYKWLVKNCFPFFIFDIELENVKNDINIDKIKTYWKASRLSLQEVSVWYKKMSHLKELCEKDKTLYCCECDEYEKRGGEKVLSALNMWYENVVKRLICDKKEYTHDLQYEVKDTDKTVLVKVIKENKKGIKEITSHLFDIFEPRVRIFGNNRYIKYGELDKDNNVINPQNLEIVDNILTIPCLFSSSDNVLLVSEPSLSLPLVLTNNIVNVGETISICEPWEEGYEYNRNILNQSLIDYSGGAIVYYNGDNWILKSYDMPGYMYSTKYKEMYFANEEGMTYEEQINYNDEDNEIENQGEHWERYFDSLPKFEKKQIEKYAYKNNKLILNPNPLIMGTEYKIDTNNNKGFCVYQDSIYPIISCDYIEEHNKKYEVFYVYEDNNVKLKPFIYFNGDKIEIKDKAKLSSSYCGTQQHCYEIKNGEFFRYKDILIEENKGEKIIGYITHNNERICFIQNGSSLSALTNSIGVYKNYKDIKEERNDFQGYTSYKQNEEFYVLITVPYIEYDSKYVSGHTTSKINELINDLKMATDDMGNILNGLMPYKEIKSETSGGSITFKDYITTPQTNDWLGIPYIPKYVSQLTDMNQQTQDKNNLYWGNIIDKVIISYNISKTELQNDNSVILTHQKENTTVNKTIINSYKSFNENKEEIYYNKILYTFTHTCKTNKELKDIETLMQNNYLDLSNIICRVEYYMGTLIEEKKEIIDIEDKEGIVNVNIQNNLNLKQVEEVKYNLYKNNNDYYGVKYIDEFNVKKEQCKFYYDDINISILNYWNMKPYTITYDNQTYNVKGIREETSFFEFIIKPFELNYGYVDKRHGNDTFYKVNHFSDYIDVKIGNITYKSQIYFNGVEKCFSYPLDNKEKLYKEYDYYCIINDKKYYAEYKNVNGNEFFKLKINEDKIYQSQGMVNSFIESDDNDIREIPFNIYCQVPIKVYLITKEGSFEDNYFDYSNDMSMAPVIIDENKIGQSLPENVIENIYIDRGTVRAMDYHLRLLEVKSLESLEQIGNGFFKFNSNNETK